MRRSQAQAIVAILLVATSALVPMARSDSRATWPSQRYAVTLAEADTLLRHSPRAAVAYLDSVRSAAATASATDLEMVASLKQAAIRALFENTLEASQRESQKWIPLVKQRRDTLSWCVALRTIGYADLMRQRNVAAAKSYDRMLALTRRARLGRMEGFALIGTSYLALQDGRLQDAERGYRSALRKLNEAGERYAARTARAGLANALSQQARPTESRREYEQVLAESREAGDLRNAADALNDLGALEFQYGDPSLAAPYYQQALIAERSVGREVTALQVQRNLALCLMAQGRMQEAAAVLDSVVNAALALEAGDVAARALGDLGGVRRSQGRLQEAETTLRRAVALRDSCSVEAWADASTDLARIEILRGKPQDARRTAHAALDSLGHRSTPSATASLEHSLGLAFLALGEPASAIAPLRESAARRRGVHGELGAGRSAVEGDLARAFLALGRRDSALAHFKLATSSWENSRAVPSDLDWREAYANEAPRLYGAYASALLDSVHGGNSASRAAEAFAMLERFRSRTLEDALLGAEARPDVQRQSLAQVQGEVLRPGELFIDIFAAPETTFIFAIDRTHVRVTGSSGASDLSPRLKRFRDLLATPGTSPSAIRNAADRLGADLFGPVADMVRQARTLLISAGGLDEFPLGMLRLPGEAGPLASARDVAIIPSATLLAAGRGAHPVPARRGLTVLSRAIDANGGRLAGVSHETHWLANRFPTAHVRENDGSRSLEQMLSAIGACDVLHIASHTRGPVAAPWRAGFLLGKGGGEDAYLTAARITRLRVPVRVCVLAGCRSAGTSTSAEGLPNLASAWLASGATTVIATLWQVEDRPTAELVKDFYEALALGKTSGEALIAAQRAARTRNQAAPTPEWGAFILLGDPDTRVTLSGLH